MAKSGRSGTTKEKVEDEEAPHHHHPYAFHVCGPRNFTTLTWRDLLNSSWSVYSFQFPLRIIFFSILAQFRFHFRSSILRLTD
ncbi:GDSL esterase/lipase [Senna tora]|uniref:GDSL esterase/lipase n=1 Tax=Senna tora TaxID=362788 RepID=A0A834WW19_9FABA|nr:GDSL esterase/lipase [Senna tora]